MIQDMKFVHKIENNNVVFTAEIQSCNPDSIYFEEYVKGFLKWNIHIPIKLVKDVLGIE